MSVAVITRSDGVPRICWRETRRMKKCARMKEKERAERQSVDERKLVEQQEIGRRSAGADI